MLQTLLAKLKTVEAIILLIIGLGTAYNTYRSGVTEDRLKLEETKTSAALMKLEEIQKQGEIAQKATMFKRDLLFSLFENTRAVVKDGSDADKKLTVEIITELLADDIEIRNSFIAAIEESSSGDNGLQNFVKNVQLQERVFEEVERQRTEIAAGSSPNAVNESESSSEPNKIDVFYLENIVDEAKPRAEQIVEILREQYPNKTIRLRLLPKSVNARSGYRIDYNQVRYEPNEEAFAHQIIQLINDNDVFNLENITGRQTTSTTKDYISVFVRNR